MRQPTDPQPTLPFPTPRAWRIDAEALRLHLCGPADEWGVRRAACGVHMRALDLGADEVPEVAFVPCRACTQAERVERDYGLAVAL